MTQFNPVPPPMPPRGPGGVVAFSPQLPMVPSTSGLAIASLVCALIFCIPIVTPFLAILFGVIALIAISRSAGRKKGTGLATAGIVIGSLVLLMHASVVVMVWGIGRPLLNGMVGNFETFVLNAEGGNIGEARAILTPSAQKLAGRSSIKELSALLQKDYGSFKSASFDYFGQVYQHGVAPPANAGNPFAMASRSSGGAGAMAGMGSFSLPIKVEFSRAGTVFGLVCLAPQVSASARSGQAVAAATPFGIESFTLVGPNGPWSFPFPPAPPTATTAPGNVPDADDASSDGK